MISHSLAETLLRRALSARSLMRAATLASLRPTDWNPDPMAMSLWILPLKGSQAPTIWSQPVPQLTSVVSERSQTSLSSQMDRTCEAG
jgi:hypothetical protein